MSNNFIRTGFLVTWVMIVANPLLAGIACADEILPVPRTVKGAQERVEEEVVDMKPTAAMDLSKQQSRVWKQALVTNMRASMMFLEQNKALPGVRTLKSGVQVRTLEPSDGPKPAKGTKAVTLKYTGKLIDGTKFASSAGNGQDASLLQLKSMTPGFRIGIKTMKIGSKAQIVVPPDQGFGDSGFLPVVGPGAVLVYEVELLGTEPAPQAADTPAQPEGQ
ncbi:FKBP-type peptidyl-prolyl cis-trans isomerase [Methyloterricola oryzae]|uniref:FKBP-type peptidyl-prolyl cis-trans isomerase n=1 Tax=Methyloterricola oryzae TaxID=1495050 RepID=UPI00069AE242|nr:FKBP-type peptidyl-prolyl cis-trans isomerase [Methyloterricola oryzae]